MINLWSQSLKRWLPQLIKLSEYKRGITPVSFANIELEFDVPVAESHPRHIFEALNLCLKH